MGEENLKDVVGARSGEVLVEKTSVGRTFAYAVSVLAQMLWIVITTLLLITDDEGHESERAWWDSDPNKHSFDFWENMSHDTGKLLPCLLLPLLIIVPPIFSRRKHRVLSTLVLCGLGLLLGGLHLLSTLVWVVQAEQDALKRRAPELLLRELISVVLALLLAFVLHSTYRTWNQGKPANAAVDVNQCRLHGAYVCLVVLSAVGVITSSGKVVAEVLPLSLFTMLLLVQLRHYATSHTPFFTRSRAIVAIDKFTAEFSLTKIERDMIKKPQTARVIDNMLTKPIFSKNLCPC